MGLRAIGTSRFLLGFGLAGVAQTILANAQDVLEKLAQNKDAKIIILDESLLSGIGAQEREAIDAMLEPVVITIGEEGQAQQERLRRAIKSTLGVDLL